MRDRLARSAALGSEARRKKSANKEHAVSSDGMRSARSLAIILIVHLAVIVLWQVLVDAFHVPKFILPSPLATVATLTSAKYAWVSNLAVTAVEILGGFALGALVGRTPGGFVLRFAPGQPLVAAAVRHAEHDPEGGARSAVHRLVQLRHFCQHPDRL